MEINKNLALFREFLKQKHKYAIIYANQTNQFSEKNYRKKAYTIKSDLAHDFDKDEYLYIPVNLGRAITRIFKDYVIGMWFSVDFWNDEKNDKFVELADKVELKLILDEAISGQSAIWYSIVRVRKDPFEELPRVEFIPLPNYCANMQWLWIGDKFEDIKEHFIFSVQKDENGKRYMYVDRYEKLAPMVWADWKVVKGWKGYYWEKWEYNKDFVFKNRVEEWVEEYLEDLPLFIFNNDLTNPNVVDEQDVKVIQQRGFVWEIPRYFNQSDYVDLADLFQEINDRWSQISVEMIKNLTSKMSVPAWFKDAINAQKLRQKKDWKEFVDNPDFLIHNPGEQPAQYITKDAEYLNMTLDKYIPMVLKYIWFVAGIPSALVYNAVFWWNAPVWTTDKEWQVFFSRIDSKQQRIYSQLQRMFVLLMKYLWETVELPTIRFKRPAVYDINERTMTAVQQINAGILSKESAIAYIRWYDEVEVQEELDRINQQEKDAYAKYQAITKQEENEEEENSLNNNEENNEHTTE